MKRPIQKQSEGGQSLLELALVLVFLLILLAGVIDLGRIMYEYLTMRDAAQEGAGYGAVFPSDCAHIKDRVMDNLPDGNYTVDIKIKEIVDGVEVAHGCDEFASDGYAYVCAGNKLAVIIDHETQITMPFISAYTGESVPMHVEIEDRIVRPPCSP